MKPDYHEYIQSPEWQRKRDEFLASGHKNSKRCVVCKAPRAPGFHIHHLTYNRLGAERVKDLALVCPKDHDLIHQIHAKRNAHQRRRTEGRHGASLKRSTAEAMRRVQGLKKPKRS